MYSCLYPQMLTSVSKIWMIATLMLHVWTRLEAILASATLDSKEMGGTAQVCCVLCHLINKAF